MSSVTYKMDLRTKKSRQYYWLVDDWYHVNKPWKKAKRKKK